MREVTIKSKTGIRGVINPDGKVNWNQMTFFAEDLEVIIHDDEEVDNNIEELAKDYSGQVSVSRRVFIDMFIGNRQFNTVMDIVKAAFIDGFKAARRIQ